MGTPALTSRGYDEKDFVQVAEYFDEAVKIASSIKDSTLIVTTLHYTSCNYRKNYFYLFNIEKLKFSKLCTILVVIIVKIIFIRSFLF